MEFLFGFLIVFFIVSLVSFGILVLFEPKGPHMSHGMHFQGDSDYWRRSKQWFWRKPWWAQIMMLDVVLALLFWIASIIGLFG